MFFNSRCQSTLANKRLTVTGLGLPAAPLSFVLMPRAVYWLVVRAAEEGGQGTYQARVLITCQDNPETSFKVPHLIGRRKEIT